MKLRSYLAILVLAGVVPLIVLTIVMTMTLARQQRVAVERGLADTVGALAIAIENDLRTSIRSLEILATSTPLDRDDLPAFYEEASRARHLHRWSTIGLIDAAGNHRLNVARPLGTPLPDLSDREYFKQVVATSRPYVSDLLTGRAIRTVDIAVAVPVIRDGQVKHVLFAGLDPDSFNAVFASRKLPTQAVTSIVSRDGLFVARSPDHASYVGQGAQPAYLARLREGDGGIFLATDRQGEELDTAYRRMGLTGWTVSFALPTAELNVAARRVAWTGAFFGAGIVVAALALAVVAARRMATSIGTLASAASALGRGEAPPASHRLPIDELNAMRGFLDGADQLLRKRARERDELLSAERAARVAAETAAHDLRVSEARVRRLVASPLIGIALATPEGFVDANDAFLAMVGHRRQDLEGRRIGWRAIVPPEHDPGDEASATHGASRPFETEFVRPDGTRVPILVGAAVLDRSPLTWVCFVLDISRQKAAERERAELLTREQAARAEAEAASTAKDQFLAMLGHELRNPLGAIAGATGILNLARAPADATARARAVIGRQVQHLSRLVDDLLDVSRVTSGKIVLNRRPLDLADLVTNVLGTYRTSGRLDRHQVSAQLTPVWVDADETRMEQVVSNLLGNALKYTPAQGRIDIRVEPQDGLAVLTVADTGVGLPANLVGKIFDLFVQGDRPLDRSQGGLGLGLTLVKALVARHGGTVEARSGGTASGAVFTIRLPSVAVPTTAATAASSIATEARRRVLIVEDNADAREMLHALLALEGHEVHETADGQAAVDLAPAIAPDVALVDIGLPGLDGYEVARRIRAQAGGKSILLVAITGYGQPEDRQRALAAGFDAHLTKPVAPERLASLLAGAGPGDRARP